MRRQASGERASLAAGVSAALLELICCASGFAASAVGAGSSSDDIRDIRGPKWVLPDWLLPTLVAAGVLVALCVFGAWRWRRRARRPHPLLPYEVALKRLADSRMLMQPSSAKEFSVAVSDIVRSYIEQQFAVIATLRTTEEFLLDLRESPTPSLAAHRPLLSEFLHQCDLAKFAGVAPTMQTMESLHQSAFGFVSETGRSAMAAESGKEPGDSLQAHDSLPST